MDAKLNEPFAKELVLRKLTDFLLELDKTNTAFSRYLARLIRRRTGLK